LAQVEEFSLTELLSSLQGKGAAACVKEYFSGDFPVWEERKAAYKCNCSRRYLTRVLVSLGKEQMLNIIREDGAVRIHCHYCNTDYEFTEEDADHLFPKNNK
jgi:molecular chaperone Hsp33